MILYADNISNDLPFSAIENYLPNFLHQKDIEIAPPRQKKEADLEETDGGSPTRSVRGQMVHWKLRLLLRPNMSP